MKKILTNFVYIIIILSIFFVVPFFKAKGKVFHDKNLILLNENSNPNLSLNLKVYYFWATWCSVCESNLAMNKFSYTYLRKLGFEFISVEEGSNGEKFTKEYIEKNQIPFPVYLSTKEFLAKNQIEAYPTTFFVNQKNEIAFFDTGMITPIGIIFRIFFMKIFYV